ncbi:MAG: sugar phosphate isomerase/epimerase family protein [Syntrophales bacterium]|nr:sugar phosphate isomerase/epimerase family protein [Syntrophales bacterium]
MDKPLKLGTAQYAYILNYTMDYTLKELSELGFRYIELMTAPPHIWPPAFDQNQRKALRNRIESLGLELVAINPTYLDLNMASPNPGMREESVRQIIDQITLAHDLGAKLIVVIVGKRHPLIAYPVEVVWEKFAEEGVLRCVEHAEKMNVIFGLENGPSLFIDTVDRMRFVLDKVRSSHMKVVFDVANASVVEPIVPAFDKIKEDLVHVHLSDTDMRTWTHSGIGEGKIDFISIAAKLREIDYRGVSILETTMPNEPRVSIIDSVEKLTHLGWHI